jgi:hypothetical protein
MEESYSAGVQLPSTQPKDRQHDGTANLIWKGFRAQDGISPLASTLPAEVVVTWGKDLEDGKNEWDGTLG